MQLQATYKDGSTEEVELFKDIDQEKLAVFSVTLGGVEISANLVNGDLKVNDQTLGGVNRDDLRLIYYKCMQADSDLKKDEFGNTEIRQYMNFFVVGYQWTEDGKNHKLGLKCFSDRVDLTEDI